MNPKEEKKKMKSSLKAHPDRSTSQPPGSNGSSSKLPQPSPHLQKMILPEGIELTKGARKEVIRQHQKWQQMLIRMIKEGSQVVVSPEGALEHVLPSKLVSLVWRTTIEQRIALEKAEQEKAGTDIDLRKARQSALAKISAEQDDQIALEEAYAIVKAARAQARAKQARLKEEAAKAAEEGSEDQSDASKHERADQANGRSSEPT